MSNTLSLEKKADVLTDYFIKRYGYERATEISFKIAPSFKDMSLEDLIKVGNKWHYANLLFNGKITNEEFKNSLEELGYE